MIYRASHTIDPSTLQISHQYLNPDSNPKTDEENSDLRNYIVNTKFRGTKLNMKQYKQKIELKSMYKNKRIPRQKSKTYRGEMGLLQSIGWNEEFSPVDETEEDWKRLQLKPLTSQRQRKKVESARRSPKTADQLMRRRSKQKRNEPPNIQNFLTAVLPTKNTHNTISYFHSQNLQPRTNQIMNVAIRNAITQNMQNSYPEQTENKNLAKMYLPNHKMLKTRLKSRSLSVRKPQKKKEREDMQIWQIGKVSPLMHKLVEEKKKDRKIFKKNGALCLSLSK